VEDFSRSKGSRGNRLDKNARGMLGPKGLIVRKIFEIIIYKNI
jgi:hypothetical protein